MPDARQRSFSPCAGRLLMRGLARSAAWGLGLALAVPAFGQYTKTVPPKHAFRIGPVRFTPRLALVNAGRDTNPYVSSVSRVDDRSATIRSGVDGFVPIKTRARLFGEGWLDWTWYQTQGTETSIDPGGAGRAELDFGPLTFTGGGGGFQARQLYSVDIDERVLRQEVYGSAGAELRLSRLLSVSGGAELRSYRFDPTARSSAGNPTAALNLDRNSASGLLALRRKLTPLTTFVASAEALEDRFVYSTESLRLTRSFRYMGGVELGQGAVLVGRLMAGLRDFPVSSSGSLPSYRGPAFLAEGTIPLFGRARLQGGINRDVFIASTAARTADDRKRNAYTLFSFNGRLESELPLGFIGRVGGSYARSDYLSPTTVSGVSMSRADNYFAASASLLRSFTDGLRIGATATYHRRVSTLPLSSYERWVYGISAEFVPPAPRH